MATIVSGFAQFKQMGDAMAQLNMSEKMVATFFRNLLDIPLDAPSKYISTRSKNMVADLERDLGTTMRERNQRSPDAWTVLNAVTRYTDHDKSVRTDGGARTEFAARFEASTFGSGDAMKGKAVNLLMPMVRELVAA